MSFKFTPKLKAKNFCLQKATGSWLKIDKSKNLVGPNINPLPPTDAVRKQKILY